MPRSTNRRRKGAARNGRRRPLLLRRWPVLVVLALVAFLYTKPIRTYLETRDRLEARSAEVERLAARKRTLERQLASRSSSAALVREARRLGYVKPGERLYIVKGIRAWERSQRRARAG